MIKRDTLVRDTGSGARAVAFRGVYEINKGSFDAFAAVFVAESDEKAIEAALYKERLMKEVPQISLIIGYLNFIGDFIPVDVVDNI